MAATLDAAASHMSDFQTAVAAAIRVRLSRLSMTQVALAETIGMSPSSLSARLAGRAPFDTRELDMIAQALSLVDLFELIDLAREERVMVAT